MLPGPVFNVELVTTARRSRYYVFRVIYGLALLAIVWQNYVSWSRWNYGVLHHTQMFQLALGTFGSVVILQAMLVLAMTPSLVAGVIANEKQRKTLHYLLSSTLSSAEIVLGKMMARMLHVAVFLAIGLPVLCLLSLLGGIDPKLILAATAGTFSIAFFLAALSVLCSTVSKKVSEALVMAYAIEMAWFVVPPLLQWNMPLYYPNAYAWISPFNDWVLASTPWVPFFNLRAMFGFRGSAMIVQAILWMIGLQVGAGIVFLTIAVLGLRPIFKNQEGSSSTRFLGVVPTKRTRRVRFFDRKPVSENPILWKELCTSRTTGAGQVVSLLLSIGFVGFIGYWTFIYAWDALGDIRTSFWNTGTYQRNFNMFIRLITTGTAIVSILGAAVWGANTITAEHEDDTWVSLTATPLQGIDVVLPKMLGILGKLRWAGVFVLVMWIIGAAFGAVHPLAIMLSAAEFVVYIAFATALGTYISVRSKSTWKSQSLTTAILVTVMGGYLMFLCPSLNINQRENSLLYIGTAPYMMWTSLLTPSEYDSNVFWFAPSREADTRAWIITCIFSIVVYLVATLILGFAAINKYAEAAGRPKRPSVPRDGPPSKREPATPPVDPS